MDVAAPAQLVSPCFFLSETSLNFTGEIPFARAHSPGVAAARDGLERSSRVADVKRNVFRHHRPAYMT